MKKLKKNPIIQEFRNFLALIIKYYRWKMQNPIKSFYNDLYNGNNKNLFI